ncbi:MAG: LacI family DNA-binding transcriptional regulator [Actinomycetota bacterium]|nr:LacI family DNA-binding transcriptional regulator [Actinomycetota bacterium]
MIERNITLNDVSKSAGVSIKTVSRVINDSKYVKKETKKKVLEVIKKLNYKPDYFARNLKKKRSNVIGYIIPDFTNQFFGMVFNGIEREFRKAGYNILVSNSDGEEKLEEKSIDVLISNRVEGIIFASTGLSGEYVKKQIEEFKIPFILIDNKLKGIKMNCVLHDNVKGAEILTNHLIKVHNKSKIAFIAGPIYETSSKRRLEGYKNSLMDNNIEIKESFIKVGQWNNNSGYKLTKQLFNQKEKPDSIFIAGSSMALGVLKALKEIDLNVPEDIKLVSFDNLDFVEAIQPPLTTLDRIEEKIGTEAAKMLINKIENKDWNNYDEVYISMEIVIRESCGCSNI